MGLGDGEPTAPNPRARIRDNQRRSRARHREFVEDLRRRVRDYEARGVQATLEMQRAARAVALENSRLRALLHSKGVSDDEIERYLASPDRGCQPRRLEVNGHRRASKGGSGASEIRGQHNPKSPAGADGRVTDASAAMCLKRLINDDGPHPFDMLEPQSADLTSRALSMNLQIPSEERGSDTSAQTSLPPLQSLSLSPHEMPCSAAAEIIAGAHGHGDECLARSILGCAGSSHCVIRNTQVLQVLQNS
ncbi:hypothetical protein VUR80DRAFT_2456 [Thermomyces stellatus]